MAGLRLAEVTRDNVRAACGLEIRPEQKGTVAPVAWSLAAAYTVPDIAWPRLVYDDDQLVGFVMAAFDPDGEVELFRSYLWRLNIGAEHQGKGYGRFAVGELCAEALRRGQHRLMVSWNEHEYGPEGFYLRLGFRPTGERNQGEIVAERILAAVPDRVGQCRGPDAALAATGPSWDAARQEARPGSCPGRAVPATLGGDRATDW